MFLNRGFASHDLVKALQGGLIELLLAVLLSLLPLPCYAEVITHCDTLR